ncbi:hypothetical protein BDZ89DRAFT_1108185 [Hymenopellis radicata]|nr:hypothetical protein BDZ89DRAFT_1108185 [Hymenopellis radicata]
MSLELMNHYANHACYTLYEEPEVLHVWKHVVPDLIFSTNCAPMLHSVLAFSALHLYHLHESDSSAAKYAYAAASHHTQALRTMPHTLPPGVEHHTTIITRVLTAIYGFATSSCVYQNSDWLEALRGTPSEVKSGWDTLHSGVLAPLIALFSSAHMFIGTGTLLDMSGPSLFPKSLSTLCDPTSGVPDTGELKDTAVLEAYEMAIQYLRRTWVASSYPEHQVYSSFTWLVSISELFFTLLRERRPRALIIVGHYCALMRRVKGNLWWARDRKKFSDEINSIQSALSEAWRPWMDWLPDTESTSSELVPFGGGGGVFTWMLQHI